MKKHIYHVPLNSAHIFDGEDYGVVFETCSPKNSSLEKIGFAFVEVKPERESLAHFHNYTEEIYYITKGRGIMTIAGEEFLVAEGDTVNIPPKAVHKIRNPGRTTLCFVCVTSPPYNPDDDILL